MWANKRLSGCSPEALNATYFSEQHSAVELHWQQGVFSRPPKVLQSPVPCAVVLCSGGSILLALEEYKSIGGFQIYKAVFLATIIHS